MTLRSIARRGTCAAALVASLWGCAPEAAAPPPALAAPIRFAAMGDMPYDHDEEARFHLLVEQVNAAAPDWVVHVGDILREHCSESRMRSRRALFEGFEAPFVYTPGDNEWADCWRRIGGRHAPLDSLALLREVFFAGGVPLGAGPRATGPAAAPGLRAPAFPALRQSSAPGFETFVENARWVHEGVVFATLHVVGSGNGRHPFRGRGPGDDAEVAAREAANAAWLSAAFAEARRLDAPAVVVIWHADPGFDLPPGDPERLAFAELVAGLGAEAARVGRPVLLVHGDSHRYVVDHPVAHPETGHPLASLTRLQVPGSPEVAWVEVAIDPAAADPFAFRVHPVGRGLRWLGRLLTLKS